MELSRQQSRTIMYYEFRNKLSATECHQKMCESLGINTVSYDTVKVWFWKFMAGNFDIEDEPRSDRPIEADFNALNRINLTFKSNRWVPHELTAEDKRNRKEACLALPQRSEKILDRIVTCDEKWVYYNNTSCKGGWSAPGESAGSVRRRALTNKKVLLCIWWDCRGIICKKRGQTINSAISATY
ncbi:Mariner Mos1 transposase [Araneus ventricosus]|uniref:Mariner Mos1 transposase n=1 Tax=Araneus ventricosus TaxID=182803 RepID=A0A4Y2ECV9_ARAVE|nr:Mariner Mos1 transposase [Araneus ventricosus]